jgi:electron transfer flavoprotein beta subunit
LKIVVCVKQVPDTAAKVVVEDGSVTWGGANLVLNPWDEYAVEAALQQKEAHGGSVTAITMAPEGPNEALKQALAMGCDEAVLISDPDLAAADTQVTARVLAAAIAKIGEVALVFFGQQAVDGDSGVTDAQTARVLGWPVLSLASVISNVDPAAGTIQVERSVEQGRQIVSGALPAVLSVVKDYGEPRYPSFMGIRKAARAQVPTWNLADLGAAGLHPAVAWPEVMNPPQVAVTCEFIEGSSPDEIAASLAERLIAEKVL